MPLEVCHSVEPLVVDSWVNLGVVFAHNDQLDDAINAYQTALQIEPSDLSAFNNLYEIYRERGDDRAAQDIQARVENPRRNNPSTCCTSARRLSLRASIKNPIGLVRRAIEEKEDDHLLYFTLAMAQYQGGEGTAAEKSMYHARELAPPDRLASYARPLDELIAEEIANREAMRPINHPAHGWWPASPAHPADPPARPPAKPDVQVHGHQESRVL